MVGGILKMKLGRYLIGLATAGLFTLLSGSGCVTYKDELARFAAQDRTAHVSVEKKSDLEEKAEKDSTKYADNEYVKMVNDRNYIINELEKYHDRRFVGKVGSFCPIAPGLGGGILERETNGKYYAVTGTSGYRWLEAEVVKELGKEDDIDIRYFRGLVDGAIESIQQYANFDWFISNQPYDKYTNEIIPF